MDRTTFLKSLIGIIAAPIVASKVIGEIKEKEYVISDKGIFPFLEEKNNALIDWTQDIFKDNNAGPRFLVSSEEPKWHEPEHLKSMVYKEPGIMSREGIVLKDRLVYSVDVSRLCVNDMVLIEFNDEKITYLITSINSMNNNMVVTPLEDSVLWMYEDTKVLISKIGATKPV